MQQLSFIAPDSMSYISGFRYISNYLAVDQEEWLVRNIDKQEWLSDLKRRVQHYGYKYDYKSKRIEQSSYIGPIPSWLCFLCNKIYSEGTFLTLPNQVIVNEYLPSHGISPHIDYIPCFGEVICSLSLGGSCVMEFENKIKYLCF